MSPEVLGRTGAPAATAKYFLDLENRYEFHRKRKLLELIKTVFRKNQDEEDIGKELQKLQEKRSALLEQLTLALFLTEN